MWALMFAVSFSRFGGRSRISKIVPPRIDAPPTRSRRYSGPPEDWPDIPVHALGLFRATGRIHQRETGQTAVRQVDSYDAVEALIIAHIDPNVCESPRIVLRLSPQHAGWTDVTVNGAHLAQVPTGAMLARAGKTVVG